MVKQKSKPQKKVKATAKCETFDIEINAAFTPRGLSIEQVSDVHRKLKQSLADAISKLPFAFIYPWEVKIK